MKARIFKWQASLGLQFQPVLLLLFRLYWGYAFFSAGLGKWLDFEQKKTFFATLPLPFPEFMVYFVGTVELVGGILLFIGLLSRLTGAILSINMIAALLLAHTSATLGLFSDSSLFLKQLPVTYLMTALIVFAFGPGRFSLDYLLCPHLRHK